MRNPTQNRGDFVRQGGFTLIELVLAAGVCAIVVTAVGGVFFSAVRLRESTERMVDESLPLERALVIVRRDLQGLMLSPSTNYLQNLKLPPPSTNMIMSGSFRVGDITSVGLNQNVSIEMYTTTGALHDNEPWADVQIVTYRLRDVPGAAGKDLVRSVMRNILYTTTPTPDEQLLLGNVNTLEFGCFDGSQWYNTWDTTQQNTNMPVAVRMRLQLSGANRGDMRRQQPIELLVPIDLQSTNLTQGAGI